MELPDKLSNKAFWDVDKENLHPENNAAFIIERVFEYGKWEDMQAVTHYYGKDNVKAVLLKSAFLYPDTINFISTIFNIRKEEMACYTSIPYHPNASIL